MGRTRLWMTARISVLSPVSLPPPPYTPKKEGGGKHRYSVCNWATGPVNKIEDVDAIKFEMQHWYAYANKIYCALHERIEKIRYLNQVHGVQKLKKKWML